MFTKQQVIVVFCILSVALLCIVPGALAEKDIAGKTFFTKANMWFESPVKIYSTNYHKGAILPAGTKVVIKKVGFKDIKFTDDDGIDYRIVYVKRHSPGVSVWDHFDRYFSEEDPMRSGGPFEKFTKAEQEHIEMGEIAEGMSKDAVIMAYGYPPPIKTPKLKSRSWIFMLNRFATKAVMFKDDKLVKIER